MPARKFDLPCIYPITDRTLTGVSHHEQTAKLIEGGASFIQVRDKTASSREFFEAAKGSLELTRYAGVKLIVNDRVDIALVLQTDGVHLGQNDLSPIEARKLLGDDAIIGFSTHTIEQVRLAKEFPIDYIAFGPIFTTKTKTDHDSIVGLDMLRRVRDEVADIPLVAIGGIKLENLVFVLNAGADSAAMISAIIGDPENIVGNMGKARRIGNLVR